MRLYQCIVATVFITACIIWYKVHLIYDTYHKDPDRIAIVCTTSMLADAARIIGKDHVTVLSLMGPGIDPHVYRACQGDVHRLAHADIIFYNGLHLEGKMSLVLANIHSYTHAYAVSDNIPCTELQAPDTYASTYDPHIWLDVSLWCRVVAYMRDILIRHDALHRKQYTINAERYLHELRTLDAYVHAKAHLLPVEKRILVTAHDAFGYFGSAYGFKVVGLQGISTESETGAKDISSLVDFLVIQQVPAIFIESSIPQRAIEAVQCATRARGFNVIIGPELYSDALGNPNTPEATYVGMIKHNIDAIVGSLLQ